MSALARNFALIRGRNFQESRERAYAMASDNGTHSALHSSPGSNLEKERRSNGQVVLSQRAGAASHATFARELAREISLDGSINRRGKRGRLTSKKDSATAETSRDSKFKL
jgi:hypothetical protein